MKWGFRKPSFRKRIAARTSWKRYLRQSLGLKAPRGWGWLTNPRKAAYNRLYRRTTFGLDDLFKILQQRRSRGTGCCFLLLWLTLCVLGAACAIADCASFLL
jgi:hypothetical protein